MRKILEMVSIKTLVVCNGELLQMCFRKKGKWMNAWKLRASSSWFLLELQTAKQSCPGSWQEAAHHVICSHILSFSSSAVGLPFPPGAGCLKDLAVIWARFPSPKHLQAFTRACHHVDYEHRALGERMGSGGREAGGLTSLPASLAPIEGSLTALV